MDDKNKPYISPTQLTMYERCGEQYRRRYVEKKIIPPGTAMLRGTGIHEGAKTNFRQKIETHEDMKKTDIIDVAIESVENKIINGGVDLSEDEKGQGKDHVIGKLKDQIATLTELYADEVAPVYQPVQVEERQRIVLPGNYDLCVILDMIDDNEYIVDLKTAQKKKNNNDVATSEQLTFYAAAYLALRKKLPKGVRFEVLVEKKIPERQRLTSQRTKRDIKTIVNRVNTMISGIDAGVFVPCGRDNWCCTEKYCGYYKTCSYV